MSLQILNYTYPKTKCIFIKKIMFQGNLPRRNIEQISINNVKSEAETSLQSEQIKFLKFFLLIMRKRKWSV